MRKFHSTVSRRDFMKGLGLVGAGAAALTAPVFHDLDEMVASETGDMANPKKPWWIKELDFEKPTVEIDWTLVKRYNSTYSSQSNNALYDKDWSNVVKKEASLKKSWMTDRKPGFCIEDYAFRDIIGNPPGSTNPWVPAATSFKSPEAQGVPKYEGTPEYNSRMLRTALRTFGAFGMAYVPLTANAQKLVYSNGYTLEDTKTGYSDAKKGNVIPTQAGITYIPLMAPEMLTGYRGNPSATNRGTHSKGNQILGVVASSGQRFLATLGYQGLSGSIGCGPAFFPLGGGSEMGRIGGQSISPTYGMTQTHNGLSTDLPIDPTHPIDAGIWKFCHTCGNCAIVCPSESINTDKIPSWEVPTFAQSFSNPDAQFSVPGKKVFFNNMSTCKTHCDLCGGGCNVCMANCVFSHLETAAVHIMVKATLGSTPTFNTFFKDMDRVMGYGLQQFGPGISPPLNGTFNPAAAEWWMTETPPFGWDGRATQAHAQ
ncbi:MAG: reductive dehalogenase [Dehalogenimonas sp.]